MNEQLKRPSYYLKPSLLYFVTLITIALVELCVMFSLRLLPELNPVGVAIIDAFLLSFFAVPILYFLLFDPLRGNIKDRIYAELEYEKATETSRMKSEFISIAAHELRTPLASILGYSDLMLGTREFNEEFVTIINQKANVMLRLIDDLHDQSLSDQGKPLLLQKETADIIPIIVTLIKSNEVKYPLRSFDVNLPKSEIRVPFDKVRIEQVFDNILNNAIKFSPEESSIEINATLRDRYLTVQIRDKGIGMSPKESSQVFDKYYRADFSNTSPAGLGIGMAIVKGIILLHGGEIRIESMPDVGTTVSFDLPVD